MTTTLTNDQITAGAAVLCDHGQPIGRNAAIAVFDAMQADTPAAFAKRYSELVCENALLKKQLAETKPKCPTCKGNDTTAPCAYPGSGMDGCLRDKRLAAPSPQVADIAELPPLPKFLAKMYTGNYWTGYPDASIPGELLGDVYNAEQMQQYARDAIAASRRAAGGEVLDAARYRWLRENNIVANVRFHFASGESPYLYAEALDEAIDHNMGYDPLATPAPASAGQAFGADAQASQVRAKGAPSAGQAAPALPEQDAKAAFKSAFLSWNGFHTDAELENEWAHGTLAGEMFRAGLAAQPTEGAGQAGQVAMPELTVWYGPMPESNGKSNFTAILMRKDGDQWDNMTDGITIDRSEYPDRVRYEADRMRYLIGELEERPFILDYDADKHSGYVAPTERAAAPADQPSAQKGGA